MKQRYRRSLASLFIVLILGFNPNEDGVGGSIFSFKDFGRNLQENMTTAKTETLTCANLCWCPCSCKPVVVTPLPAREEVQAQEEQEQEVAQQVQALEAVRQQEVLVKEVAQLRQEQEDHQLRQEVQVKEVETLQEGAVLQVEVEGMVLPQPQEEGVLLCLSQLKLK